MPRVRREKTFVPAKDGKSRVQFMMEVKVGRAGLFSIAVPSWLVQAADRVDMETYSYSRGEVTNKSMSDAVSRWTALMAHLEKMLANEVREKVLSIRVGINASIPRLDAEGEVLGMLLQSSDFHFCEITPCVALSYRVHYRIGDKVVDEEGNYRYRTGNSARKRDPDDPITIPYTEERERFLQRAIKSLELVALRLDAFRTQLAGDPKRIDKILGMNLLAEKAGRR